MAVDENKHWCEYNKKTSNVPPRPLVKKALELFDGFTGKAIDLGCGAENDSVFLIENGWSVLAVDKNPSCFESIKTKLQPCKHDYFTGLTADFESLKTLPICDLVNSSYSLPFCHPSCFDNMMSIIKSSILPGGRFAGNFFGLNDSWAALTHMSFRDKTAIENLFRNFAIELIDEHEYDGKTAMGKNKHWHIINVIARKP